MDALGKPNFEVVVVDPAAGCDEKPPNGVVEGAVVFNVAFPPNSEPVGLVDVAVDVGVAKENPVDVAGLEALDAPNENPPVDGCVVLNMEGEETCIRN